MTGTDGRGFDADADAQRWLLDQLAAAPAPPLPDEVRARWDEVIAGEADQRAAAPPAAAAERSRWSGRWVLTGAAAAAVVILAGVVAVPRLAPQDAATTAANPAPEQTPPTDGCAVSGSPDANLQPVMSDTGSTYTEETLATQAASLQRRVAPCGGATTQGRESDGTAMTLTSAQAVSACVVTVADGHPVLAVDNGWYDRKEAVVAVIRVPPVRAYVLNCEATPVQVVEEVDLPQE